MKRSRRRRATTTFTIILLISSLCEACACACWRKDTVPLRSFYLQVCCYLFMKRRRSQKTKNHQNDDYRAPLHFLLGAPWLKALQIIAYSLRGGPSKFLRLFSVKDQIILMLAILRCWSIVAHKQYRAEPLLQSTAIPCIIFTK